MRTKKLTHILLLILSTVVFFSPLSWAAQKKEFVYEYYEGKGDEDGAKQLVEIKDLPDGKKDFNRKIEGEDFVTVDELIVDDQYDTLTFSVPKDDDKTSYTSEVKDDTILIKGGLKRGVDRKNYRPRSQTVYYTSEFNLAKFILSDLKELNFWTLRKDLLT